MNHGENYSINNQLNLKSTISHKSSCDLLCFQKNVLKNIWLVQRYPSFPLSLDQCCVKATKAMPNSAGQECTNKLATKII